MDRPVLSSQLIAEIQAGDEALDRGLRGPSRELSLLKEAGLLSAPLDGDHNGLGWGTSPDGARFMLGTLVALGGASLPIARLYEGHVNAIKLVTALGTEDQRDNVAAMVHDGTLLGVWGANSQVPVEIVDTDGVLTLCGAKAFASGLGDVGLAIVTAECSGGLQMILIDARDPDRADHKDWDVDAMVGSRSGKFNCEGLTADRGVQLGSKDALFLEPAFHGGLWRLAACYAGALARIARLLAGKMKASGQSSVPQMHHRLGQVAIEAEGALLWATHACLAVEQAKMPTESAVRAALFAREAVEANCDRALSLAERSAGTLVHRRGDALGRVMRDLRFYLRQADLDGKLALATHYWIGEY